MGAAGDPAHRRVLGQYGIAGAGDGPLLHHKGHQPPPGAFLLDPRQRLRSDKLTLIQFGDPAQPGLDRVGLGGNVLAIEAILHLQTEGVPGAQARRLQARRLTRAQQIVPQSGRSLGIRIKFKAQLAAVAGAADQQVPPMDLCFPAVVKLQGIQFGAQHLGHDPPAGRSLHRQ